MSSDSIKVAVRVRPFNEREKKANSQCVIQMHGQMTSIVHPETREARAFTYDYSYWSHDGFTEGEDGVYVAENPAYADQGRVYDDLGKGILENAWQGYNATLFAYGQTGGGKSYSMTGYGSNRGLIPLLCEELFSKIKEQKDSQKQFHVTFSMLEIYNEQIRDLLCKADAAKEAGGLRLRQHPTSGFYVQGLKRVPVQEYSQMERLMERGTLYRTTASTNMNSTSSRSHMVITVTFKQIYQNELGESTTKSSEIRLVDLAGSERAYSSGAQGDRLKEGSSINQSLSTLGKVMSALAEQSVVSKKKIVVPYRDSALTKLLQTALGGNSKTAMIACVSPAAINHDETLSTLRYADRAKRIQNKAVINENPTEKLIRELKVENKRLQEQLRQLQDSGMGTADLEDMLAHNEHEMNEETNQRWEERLMDARQEWEQSLISSQTEGQVFASNPYLQNVNEDPQLSGVVKICLSEGKNILGKPGKPGVTIEIRGLSILDQHANIINTGDKVYLEPSNKSAKVVINGERVKKKTQLGHCDRIQLGSSNLYLYIGFPSERSPQDNVSQFTYDFFQTELAEATGMLLTPRTSVRKQKSNRGTEDLEDLSMEWVFQEYVDLLPKVNQVNAMSEEMKKGVEFTPEIKNLATHDAYGRMKTREVVVRVHNKKSDKVWLWSTGKFFNRKFLIEELYQCYLEGQNTSLNPDKDPFWDPLDDVLLGTSHLWLHNMAYCLDFDDQLEVLDDRGEEVGRLYTRLAPCDNIGRILKDEKIVFDPHDQIGKRLDFILQISKLTGVKWAVTNKTRGIYCSFKFFKQDSALSTVTVKGTSHPDFKFHQLFNIPHVTEDLLNYLQSQALVIEVWGTQSEESSNPKQSSESKDKALTDAMELIQKLEEKLQRQEEKLKRQEKSLQGLVKQNESAKSENLHLKQCLAAKNNINTQTNLPTVNKQEPSHNQVYPLSASNSSRPSSASSQSSSFSRPPSGKTVNRNLPQMQVMPMRQTKVMKVMPFNQARVMSVSAGKSSVQSTSSGNKAPNRHVTVVHTRMKNNKVSLDLPPQSSRPRSSSITSLNSSISSDPGTSFDTEIAKALKLFFMQSRQVENEMKTAQHLNEDCRTMSSSQELKQKLTELKDHISSVHLNFNRSVGSLKDTMVTLIRKKRQESETSSNVSWN